MIVFRAPTANQVWCQAHAAILDTDSTPRQPGRCGDTLEIMHVAMEIDDPR